MATPAQKMAGKKLRYAELSITTTVACKLIFFMLFINLLARILHQRFHRQLELLVKQQNTFANLFLFQLLT